MYGLAGRGDRRCRETVRLMETNYKDIYIGKLIEQKVKERHLTCAEFARMIHVARTSLYHIFDSKTIDVERLLLISKVLDYDFIGEVYMKKTYGTDLPGYPGAHIVLPLRNKDIDLSELPPEILSLLREKINGMEP